MLPAASRKTKDALSCTASRQLPCAHRRLWEKYPTWAWLPTLKATRPSCLWSEALCRDELAGRLALSLT